MNENTKARPFGLKDKLGYAMGDFGNNFTFLFANMYLMTFCTDVLGLAAGVVGLVISMAKIVDAFTDFGMGRICDLAKPTNDGRFRPWIKRMAIPMGLSSMLIYQYWVSGFSYGMRIAWIAIFYILWGSVFYTACNIPYGSMASVITNNAKERTQLSTWRTVGATLAGLGIGMIAPQLVFVRNAAGQQVVAPQKFTLTAVIFGILAIVFYLLCYKLTVERVQIDPAKAKAGQPKLSVGETLKNLITCRPLLAIIIVALITLIASLGTSALNTYLFKDYFNNTRVMALSTMAGTVSMLLMAPVATKLSTKIGKKETGCLGILISAVIFFILWVLKLKNPIVYIALYTLQGMGMGLNSMVTWAYIGDVIDYQEVKTGVRTDGTVYSTYSFVRKIAQAAAAGLGGFLLTSIGYVSSTAGEAVVQTEAVTTGIYNCMTLLPAVLYVLAFLCMYFLYPLGKKQVDENTHILEERRAAQN